MQNLEVHIRRKLILVLIHCRYQWRQKVLVSTASISFKNIVHALIFMGKNFTNHKSFIKIYCEFPTISMSC